MTVTFEHLALHGVPQKDIELMTHWFQGFPPEVQDPQLAVLWALQVLPWERTKALMAEAFDHALAEPTVVINDDARLRAVAALLHAEAVDHDATQQASEECYRVVDTYARMYGLDDRQEDGGERMAQALTKVVLNPSIDPTIRVWVGTMPALGALVASTFKGIENHDQLVARSVFSTLLTLLPPPKHDNQPARTARVNDMLVRVYAELADYLSTWARPWGT